MRHYVGVDLGQRRDYSAITVLEQQDHPRPKRALPGLPEYEEEDWLLVRMYNAIWFEQLAKGTTYPAAVERIKTVLQHPRLAGRAALVVDATGVGVPVIDYMRQAGLAPIPVTITGGAAVHATDVGFTVPKRDLVITLQVLFDSERLRIAANVPHRERFIEQLNNFTVKISRDGHDAYEAALEDVHDDIVLSTALAAWYAEASTGRQVVVPASRKERVEQYDPLRHGL